MSNKKFTVYYFIDHGYPDEGGPTEMETWGVFEAEDETAAIELALAEHYADADGHVELLAGVSLPSRSIELDRPCMSAMEVPND